MLEIMSILKDYGWKGLLLAAVLFLIYKTIGDSIKTFSEKAKNKLLRRSDVKLNQHAFFNAIAYSLNVELPAMTLFADKPVRQVLMRDLVYCSLASVEEVCESIAEADHSEWNHSAWNYEMRAAVNEMNRAFVEKCTNRGMPESVYRKYLGWYFKRLNSMRTIIDQISGAEIFDTPHAKTSALFVTFNLFLVTMITDAETTLKELNGDITGVMYKGGIVEPLHDFPTS